MVIGPELIFEQRSKEGAKVPKPMTHSGSFGEMQSKNGYSSSSLPINLLSKYRFYTSWEM